MKNEDIVDKYELENEFESMDEERFLDFCEFVKANYELENEDIYFMLKNDSWEQYFRYFLGA